MVDVFISYAHQDRIHAQLLAKSLRDKGFSVWWDRELLAGENFRTEIRSKLSLASKVIVLWSKHSIFSSFVIDEATLANKSRKLIPILLDSCDIPLGFGGIHTIKVERIEAEIDFIVAAITTVSYAPKRTKWRRISRMLTPPARRRTLVWLTVLCASIAPIIQAYPIALAAAKAALGRTNPQNRAVFVSDDQPFAMQYLSALAERGFSTEYVALDHLNDLNDEQTQGVLIVHSRNNNIEQIKLDADTQRRLSGKVKLVGMGNYGARLMFALDQTTMLADFAALSSTVAILDQAIPRDIGDLLPREEKIKLYEKDAFDGTPIVAAYDHGSAQMRGALGVARITNDQQSRRCDGNDWTIALQGNKALWGYSLPGAMLTPEGRQIFKDFAAFIRDSPYAEDEGRALAETKPGSISGELGCGLKSVRFNFHPTQEGKVRAVANASRRVALVLNGPFQQEYLQRDEGQHAKIEFHIDKTSLASSGYWSVSIEYLEQLGPDDKIPYSFSLDYPLDLDISVYWLFLGGGSLGVCLLAVWQLLRIALQNG